MSADVDVFILPVPPGPDDAGLDLLDADERARWDRFKFAPDRRIFAAAHALLRAALSRWGDSAAPDWRFQVGRWGRPELAEAQAASGLRFNLSHTRGMVACAVTRGRAVGIDVEGFDTAGRSDGVARRAFTDFERAQIEASPADRRTEAFMTVWSLKEAYVKARGLGLSLPLTSFSVAIAPPRILPAPDDTGRWHAESSTEDGAFRLSLVVALDDQPLRVAYSRVPTRWLDDGAGAALPRASRPMG